MLRLPSTLQMNMFTQACEDMAFATALQQQGRPRSYWTPKCWSVRDGLAAGR